MKKSLNTKTNTIELIINFPKKDNKVIDTLNGFLKSTNNSKWAYIIHDKDTGEDGVLKTKHIHLIYLAPSNERKMLLTWLNVFSSILNLDNNLIQISCCPTYLHATRFQYLIHKNDFPKYPYPYEDIVTNLNEEELTAYMESDITEEITIQCLINKIMNYNSLTEVYKDIGIANALKYRNIIKDIFSERSMFK